MSSTFQGAMAHSESYQIPLEMQLQGIIPWPPLWLDEFLLLMGLMAQLLLH